MDRGWTYRPEYRLDRLRMMTLGGKVPAPSQTAEEGAPSLLQLPPPPPLLLLRWLRTMVVDLSHTVESRTEERLALHRRSHVGCAVERIVCEKLDRTHFSQLLPTVTKRVRQLTFLDLRGCHVNGFDHQFLHAIADTHALSLRVLHLPFGCRLSQSLLDCFTQLEELDASGCENLTNVDFCSATLRVLYATACNKLTNAGLRNATRLEVLHINGCSEISDLSPFAHRLLELDISWNCSICSETLRECYRLQVLHAHENEEITTLHPFARHLRELTASGEVSSLRDAALADATGLVKLSKRSNHHITTIAPFRGSLRWLDAQCSVTEDHTALATATHLVYLNASQSSWMDPSSSSLQRLLLLPCSLLELEACQCDSIDDAALSSSAPNLIWLDVSDNSGVTTVSPFGHSLRHLIAVGGDCALTNEGVSTATQLVTLDCRGNSNLTTITPFLDSLEELDTSCATQVAELENAPWAHRVEKSWDVRDTVVFDQLKQLGFVMGGIRIGFAMWIRDTQQQGQ